MIQWASQKSVSKIRLWAVTRAWPIPMPIHADSNILPTLFATTCEMEMPCRDPMSTETSVFNLTSFNLTEVFCFSLHSSSQHCVRLLLKNVTSWDNPLQYNSVSLNILTSALTQVSQGLQSGSGVGNNSGVVNITTLVTVSTGHFPWARKNATNATRFLASPACTPYKSFPPIFTHCQDRNWDYKEVAPGFSISPSLKKFSYNFTKNGTSTGSGWPFYQ